VARTARRAAPAGRRVRPAARVSMQMASRQSAHRSRARNSVPVPDPLFGHGDLAASLVVIFPLLLAYQVAVLFGAPVNGADLVTRALYVLCGRSAAAYLLVHASLAIVFLLWMRRIGRQGALRIDVFAPLVLESAIYGLCLGTVISLLMHHALGMSLAQTLAHDTMVTSLGAGVHEELLFRCCGIALLTTIGLMLGLPRRPATAIAMVATALLFALAHHVGAYGEPMLLRAVVYRTLAGLAFAMIYWYRSLGHAVYAHVIYDLALAWM